MCFLITFAGPVLWSGRHDFLMDERRSRRVGQSPALWRLTGSLSYMVPSVGVGEARIKFVEEAISN